MRTHSLQFLALFRTLDFSNSETLDLQRLKSAALLRSPSDDLSERSDQTNDNDDIIKIESHNDSEMPERIIRESQNQNELSLNDKLSQSESGDSSLYNHNPIGNMTSPTPSLPSSVSSKSESILSRSGHWRLGADRIPELKELNSTVLKSDAKCTPDLQTSQNGPKNIFQFHDPKISDHISIFSTTTCHLINSTRADDDESISSGLTRDDQNNIGTSHLGTVSTCTEDIMDFE